MIAATIDIKNIERPAAIYGLFDGSLLRVGAIVGEGVGKGNGSIIWKGPRF
jgi:hypothetical protein